MSDFLFNELNSALSTTEAWEPKAQRRKVPAGDYNVEITECELKSEEDATKLTVQMKVLGGEYEDEVIWNTFWVKGGKFAWMNERDLRFIKQIQMIGGLDAINRETDLIGITLGVKLEERNGYVNLKRVFTKVNNPGPSTEADQPEKTTMNKVSNSDPFASF